MIHAPQVPDEQYIGAVPEQLFVEGLTQEVREQIYVDEAHVLNMRISPYQVYFVDAQNSQRGLNATYNPTSKSVEAAVFTRWEAQGQRHVYPGLYAARLLTRTITYFDAVHGPLELFMSQWDVGSDNRKQYEAALATYDNPTYKDKRRAAFATWSGGIALQSGFKDIIGEPYDLPAADGTTSISVEFTRRVQAVKGPAGLPKRVRR